MEPISTAAFCIYFAGFAVPTQLPNYSSHKNKSTTAVVDAGTLLPKFFGIESEPAKTKYSINCTSTSNHLHNRLEAIKDELDSYGKLESGFWGDEIQLSDSADIERAKHLLDQLPSGFPFPTPMISSEGQIGFYWNEDDYYADIHLEDNQSLSVYWRKKLANQESEKFIDGLNEASITTEWFKENLSLIS